MRLEPLQSLLERANQALGWLDGLASILPDISPFLYMYVRKEAVLSSQVLAGGGSERTSVQRD